MLKVDSFIKLYLLIALQKGKRHGYELMKELEAKLGKAISAAHIYPFLKGLQKRKYVRAIRGARSTAYTLTRNGNSFVTKTLLQFHEIIQESLRKKLTSCTHCGCEVYNSKYTEAINGKQRAFCCRHCAASYKQEPHHG
ncbi:helix-turn-helix transcriptional regulator [Candidatus Woesearchaeota archaeon]|nr:helix-turn-helix transcriptional regulator [Candidatus Woesearchaeota archaeon]